jgi:hypothetical protein
MQLPIMHAGNGEHRKDALRVIGKTRVLRRRDIGFTAEPSRFLRLSRFFSVIEFLCDQYRIYILTNA